MKLLFDNEPMFDRDRIIVLPVTRDILSALADSDKEFMESHKLQPKQIENIARLALELPKLYTHGYSSEEEYRGLKRVLNHSSLSIKPEYQQIIKLLERYT